MRILVTGGAGFVGSSLCRLMREKRPQAEIVAFDNLHRRGSELNLPVFRDLGIRFVHGDVRNPLDFEELDGNFDLFIEASAEPSVHAGTGHNPPGYLLHTNLTGTLNCLEFGRRRTAGMIFLSTSRVYSIQALRELKLDAGKTRFELAADQTLPGASGRGVAETFPTVGRGSRSLYGSTKLASELFVEEYAANYNYPAVINRCGVIAGPGQFGKVDQGVFTLWVARHLFGGELAYTGFGGQGHQVRDLLHPEDLFALLEAQWQRLDEIKGRTYSIGGGVAGSVSLREYTALCEQVVGKAIKIASNTATADVDIPCFIADSRLAAEEFGWQPKKAPLAIVSDIHAWLKGNLAQLTPLFT